MNAHAPGATARSDQAATVAGFLFPTDLPNGPARDLRGEDWLSDRKKITAHLMTLPPEVLAAFTLTIERLDDHDGSAPLAGQLRTGQPGGGVSSRLQITPSGIAVEVGKMALDWIDMGINQTDERSRRMADECVRQIGSVLAFADILEAAARCPADTFIAWSHRLGDLSNWLGQHQRAEEGRGRYLSLPATGYLGADPAELAKARAYVLGAFIVQGPAAGRLDEATLSLLLRHQSDPGRVIAVAAERGTLDPSVIGSVLDSRTPAISEGSL